MPLVNALASFDFRIVSPFPEAAAPVASRNSKHSPSLPSKNEVHYLRNPFFRPKSCLLAGGKTIVCSTFATFQALFCGQSLRPSLLPVLTPLPPTVVVRGIELPLLPSFWSSCKHFARAEMAILYKGRQMAVRCRKIALRAKKGPFCASDALLAEP